jgi:hypothetical protein
MDKAKSIVVTGENQDPIKASIVLEAIGKYLEIPERKRTLRADNDEDAPWFAFGYYVDHPRRGEKSKRYRKLREATRKSGWGLAWIGYAYNNKTGKGKKTVEFQLDDEKKRDSLKQKLTNSGFKAEPDRGDDGAYCVRVSSPQRPSEPDFEWFKSVVDCAISK